MNERQKELIKLCGYKIVGNKLVGEKECISNIYFDNKTKLFSINIKAYKFTPGDYETIETFSITLNHMLGLIYELNLINDKESTKICPICNLKYNDYPAISRKDNKTEICPDCGTKEALEDFIKFNQTK